MRKFLFFAAACVALVACNNKDNALNSEQPKEPGRQITLTANVDFGKGSNAPGRMVAPDTPIPTTDGATVDFHWEAGDQVMLMSYDASENQLFTIVDNSIQGNSANFTGTALTDMTGYFVFYAGKNISEDFALSLLNVEPIVLTNATNNYNILAIATDGDESGFTLNVLSNTLRLPLTGDVTLGSITCCPGSTPDTPKSTLNFGTSGLALTTTAQEVWIPYAVYGGSIIFRFYDTDGELIMEKSKTMDWSNIEMQNALITFPELEVKEPTLVMTPAKYQTFGWLYSDLSTRVNNIGFAYGTDEGYDCYYVSEAGKTDFENAKPYSEKILYYSNRVYYYCYIPSSKLSEIICSYEDYLADSDGKVTMNGHTASFWYDGDGSQMRTWAEHLSARSTLMNNLPYNARWRGSYTYYFYVEASAVAGSDLVMLTIWNKIDEGI